MRISYLKIFDSVYGIGLNEPSILSNELLEIRNRLAKLETALKSADNEEIQNHLKFAIEHHKKKNTRT